MDIFGLENQMWILILSLPLTTSMNCQPNPLGLLTASSVLSNATYCLINEGGI